MQNLRALRRSRSLTFLDLSVLTGIPARQIAEIEYGLRRLSGQERSNLALVLGLAPDSFTGAHRRLEAAAQQPLRLPGGQRALEALIAAALSATLATGAVLNAPELQLAPSGLHHETPRGAAGVVEAPLLQAGGILAELELMPTAHEAMAIAQLGEAILTLRAVRPQVALAPRLVVAPTPPESVAPAPLPVIEQAPAFVMTDEGPLGCPVKPQIGQVVMTQGYGVGTHAPADTWGAIDLAVDGDGDGYGDSSATWYAPVVATHDGTVDIHLETWPAGNHVWVNHPQKVWRSGYAHLALVTVVDGQYVRAGEQIGMIGSTGMSTGPHLHYHLWRNGINIDPTNLVGCR